MSARRAAAVVPFLLVTLFMALLVVPAGPAVATDLENLALRNTSARFSRSLAVESTCEVLLPLETLCAAPLVSVFSPETITVNCPMLGGCVLELQTCVQYDVFSPSSGIFHFGGSLFFTVDGELHLDRASHDLVVVDREVTNQSQSNACFLAFVPNLARGPHTVGLVVGADIFGGGVLGDRATLDIRSASLAVRLYRE